MASSSTHLPPVDQACKGGGSGDRPRAVQGGSGMERGGGGQGVAGKGRSQWQHHVPGSPMCPLPLIQLMPAK